MGSGLSQLVQLGRIAAPVPVPAQHRPGRRGPAYRLRPPQPLRVQHVQRVLPSGVTASRRPVPLQRGASHTRFRIAPKRRYPLPLLQCPPGSLARVRWDEGDRTVILRRRRNQITVRIPAASRTPVRSFFLSSPAPAGQGQSHGGEGSHVASAPQAQSRETAGPSESSGDPVHAGTAGILSSGSRNAIASSYSALQCAPWSLLYRRRSPWPAWPQTPQSPANKARRKPGVPARPSHSHQGPDKVAPGAKDPDPDTQRQQKAGAKDPDPDTQRQQKAGAKDPDPDTQRQQKAGAKDPDPDTQRQQKAGTLLSSSGSRKRKTQLLRPWRGGPLSLPPAPQLGYPVTVEDVEEEKRARLRRVSEVFLDSTQAASSPVTQQPPFPQQPAGAATTAPATTGLATAPPSTVAFVSHDSLCPVLASGPAFGFGVNPAASSFSQLLPFGAPQPMEPRDPRPSASAVSSSLSFPSGTGTASSTSDTCGPLSFCAGHRGGLSASTAFEAGGQQSQLPSVLTNSSGFLGGQAFASGAPSLASGAKSKTRNARQILEARRKQRKRK
ncbi:nuclear envelope pore membrane protein POM 121-like [Thomomys bottae]